jgi:O-antigen chain-terminating methyltransferase
MRTGSAGRPGTIAASRTRHSGIREKPMKRGEPAGGPSPDKNETRDLSDLVANLTEVYQPIFDHPELSDRAVRECEARLADITQIYKALASQLGRPLRVLDLGCAQGYFSFGLAKLGATVSGLDFVDRNIAVCHALAAEHPAFQVHFQTGRIEEAIARIQPEQYDLMLGLSVFHHLVHQLGVDPVQRMFHRLADATLAGVFELALNCEPLFWAAAQPPNPKRLMEAYAFVRELARHPSHLSCVHRPLYVASNFYWFVGDHAEAFHSWEPAPDEFVTIPMKGRHFFGDGHIVKLFSLDGPIDFIWRDEMLPPGSQKK